MPIILDLHTETGAHILAYQGIEDLDFFTRQTHLTKGELDLIAKYSIMRRKKDLVIARYLLQQIMSDAEVAYFPNGKPYLKNKKAEISISHSKDIVAIIVHPSKIVGIDIEYISPRIKKVQHRFLSKEEIAWANTTSRLTLYWSAKETLFKLDKDQGLEFESEISLSPSQHGDLLTGRIRKEKNIPVHYLYKNDWVLTFAVI